MSESTVVDFLREQPARVHLRFDRLDGDTTDLNGRMTGVEAGLAEVNGRLGHADARLDRIGRRPVLAGAH